LIKSLFHFGDATRIARLVILLGHGVKILCPISPVLAYCLPATGICILYCHVLSSQLFKSISPHI
jgi:hypothetical protein